jgi:hypothetical protein
VSAKLKEKDANVVEKKKQKAKPARAKKQQSKKEKRKEAEIAALKKRNKRMQELVVIRKVPVNPANLLPPHEFAKSREKEDRTHVEKIKLEILEYNSEVTPDPFMVGLVITPERFRVLRSLQGLGEMDDTSFAKPSAELLAKFDSFLASSLRHGCWSYTCGMLFHLFIDVAIRYFIILVSFLSCVFGYFY